MQRNTSIAARALVRITCRHVGAGVDTARYLFAERRKKKKSRKGTVEGRGKRVGWIVSLLATTSLPSTAPFPAFLSVHACIFLFLSFSVVPLSGRVTYLPFSNVWTFRLSSVTRRKRRLSCWLSRGEEYTPRASNIRKAIFQFDSRPRSARYFFVPFTYVLRGTLSFAKSEIKLFHYKKIQYLIWQKSK